MTDISLAHSTHPDVWSAVSTGSLIYTLRSVNDVTEGSTQEAHMCAS